MSIEAMKQALEALEWIASVNAMDYEYQRKAQKSIDALRAAIEHAERPSTHSEECWRWHHECAAAKINQLQAGIETLHAMYEQACQQRDYLMDQQRAQIEAMRGRVQ